MSKLELIHSIDTGGGKALAVAFDPKNPRLAIGARDGTVSIADIESGEITQKLRGHHEFVYCMAFHPGGEMVLSSGKDKTLRVWNLEAGELEADFAGIVSGAGSRTVFMTMTASGQGHTKTPLSVAWNEDGSLLGSGSQDQLVKLWENGNPVRTFDWHGGPVTCVGFRPGTDTLLSGSRDGTLRSWNRETGAMIHKYTGHNDEIEDFVWLDADRFVSGDVSGSVLFWEEQSESSVGSAREPSAIRCMAASPDGNRIYLGLESGDISVRNTDTGRRKKNKRLDLIEAHDLAVRSLSVNPDGLVASGGNDGVVHIWKPS